MKIKIILTAIITMFLAAGLTQASEKTQAELEKKAKITRQQAEKTALTEVKNAKVKKAELEEEDGILIWTFDLTTTDSKDITEVHVDANSGKVIKVEKESSEDEKKEKEDEKDEHKD